ncbi:MAG: Fe-S protein assembly co-chaperone HscB [Ottowia sp.]|jgi:molecular chaperone HscB|uniref:Co-chaperone protein HscB homolog n=1 Tax=Ottowia beijingensis TaxID=1207057 RepID=A0A853IKT3_9BURK|nr:Fe-S protein assembly co-chaperone HscB [Ottowia beijingensis]MBP7530706.1 Fe-S protein assembly co-chaperone HscB [Ottowia sp.]MBP7536609.1 Fe-S protein assembly co-chaperone HscB [Ottowia sp.]MBP9955150.1 Fe-S protein assembly co-chaperone HscB [Ottowia sp.]NZA00976.1 Fe-S protein assembly co-chaperone HscB [Ottowia beijingensis]HRL35624.1 Fe-S protein assembly co-chaperone HscB [Ottowia beijingensis]
MNLQSTDFELFAVPPRFAQDAAQLDARWKELQRQVHPDKFAAQGAAAQRVAMQWSARINEAYRRLKDPLKRAAYLCELNGAPIDAESNTAMPAEFLMQQMELREAVDDAVDAAAMDEIGRQSATLKREMLLKLEQQMDAQHDWPAAAQTVRALMFLDRLAGDIDRKRATLE